MNYHDLFAAFRNLDAYPRHEQKTIIEKLAFGFYLRKGQIPPQPEMLRRVVNLAPPGFKFNPYHDDLGRFTFGPGGRGNDEKPEDDSTPASEVVDDRIGRFLQWALGIGSAHAAESEPDAESGPASKGDPAIEEEVQRVARVNPAAVPIAREYYSGLQTLGQLDPSNPLLNQLRGPDGVPRADDLDEVNVEIGTASIQRVTNFCMPGDRPVEEQGDSWKVRILPGGLSAAQDDFEYLIVGGTTMNISSYPGTMVQLPGNNGLIGLRLESSSGPPSLDITVPTVLYEKIHYK